MRIPERPRMRAVADDGEERVPQPTTWDIQELLAFLPKLYADGFVPIKRVHGKDRDGEFVVFP